MSEVKRYRFQGAAGEYVYFGDYDNSVRCFLDAAERCVAAERREQDLSKELERTKRAMEINGNSAQGKHLEGLRYRDERDALQLRLNVADQRIDELGGLLNELVQIWASADSTLDLAMMVERFAPRARDALKPAECEQDHQISGTSGVRLNLLANQGE